MDYKNPNKVEEDLGDPVKMLEKFRKPEQEMKIEKRDAYQEKMMHAVVMQAFKKETELRE